MALFSQAIRIKAKVRGRAMLAAMLVSALFPIAPAHADVAGRYEMTGFPNMKRTAQAFVTTMEVNDDGAVRMQQGTSSQYMLYRDGKAYIVQRGPNGPYAVTINDYFAAQAALVSAMTSMFEDNPIPTPPAQVLRETGPATLESGLSGRGYALFPVDPDENGDVQEPTEAFLVISDDPKLAPLGYAWRTSILASIDAFQSTMFAGLFAQVGYGQYADAMQTGGVIKFQNMELTAVSTDDIPDERFALPDLILTRDQAVAMMAPFAFPPTLPALVTPDAK